MEPHIELILAGDKKGEGRRSNGYNFEEEACEVPIKRKSLRQL